MIDKLAALRLTGMVEALKAQQQDAGAQELTFLERLSVGGSAVELASESGAGPPAEDGQVTRQ